MKHSLAFILVFLLVQTRNAYASSRECETKLGALVDTSEAQEYSWRVKTKTWGPEKVNFLPYERTQAENVDYPKNLKQVGTRLAKRSNLVDKAEVVLYPMSGYDGTAPFMIFPNAKTVIGIDNHPFIDEREPAFKKRQKRIEIRPQIRGGAWANTVNDVNGELNMATPLLGTLPRLFKGFRLKKITVVQNFVEGKFRKTSFGDGIIEFDTGPGTVVRRYIHLQRDLEEMGDSVNQKRMETYLGNNSHIDTIMIKGSNNAVDARKESGQTDSSEQGNDAVRLARSYLKTLITESKYPLLLIEGESVREASNGIRGPEFSGWDNNFPKASKTGQISVGDYYSYGTRLFFHEFRPNGKP